VFHSKTVLEDDSSHSSNEELHQKKSENVSIVPQKDPEPFRTSSASTKKSLSSSSSSCSSSSLVSEIRGELSTGQENEENIDVKSEAENNIDEANKDESSSVVVEMEKCSVEFEESSDKDSEEVSEPVIQIEVCNDDTSVVDNSDEIIVEESEEIG